MYRVLARIVVNFVALLFITALAPAQNLATVDTGWVICNEGTLDASRTYPYQIAVSPDPCKTLVIDTISLEYRYSGTARVLPQAPAPVYVGGGGGSVIYGLAAQPSTFYDPFTQTWGGGGEVYGVVAGGGGFESSCILPGGEAIIDDITSFWMVGDQHAVCVSQNFPILGERRGWPIARAWFTPRHFAQSEYWYWGWQVPVPPGSWGSHSPVQYEENPMECRFVFAYRWN